MELYMGIKTQELDIVLPESKGITWPLDQKKQKS
jgi:hypothetical protein